MCTHNLCFEQKKKNILIFYMKINIFTAVKYCCILHGRVCVMACSLQKIKEYIDGDFSSYFFVLLELFSFASLLLYLT